MNALLHALQFLTRLPGLQRLNYRPESAGAAVTWYPVVGLIIGTILMGTYWCFGEVLGAPAALLACLLIIVWVWLTGALHLDGLADCADALMGAHDKDRFLAILKDTHLGVGAVVAVVLVLVTKVAAMAALINAGHHLPIVLLLPPLIARAMMAWVLVLTPYLRDEGLGADVKRHANPANLAICSVLTLAFVTWLAPLHGCLAVIAALIACGAIYQLIVRRIGGATGDVYGTTVETCETACLIALALL